MKFREVTAKEFLEHIEKFGAWFAEGINFETPYRDKWELHVVGVRPFDDPYGETQSYLAYAWEEWIDDYPGKQAFFMIIGEYTDDMNGLPACESYYPMAAMVHVGYRNKTPIYMGIWEDVEYYVPTLEDDPDWIIE